MKSVPQYDSASSAIALLLEALKISKVICVDDTYSDEPEVEEVIGLSYGVDPSELSKIFPEIDSSLYEDRDILAGAIRDVWTAISGDDRIKRGKQVLGLARLQNAGDERDDSGDAVLLSGLIPPGKLEELSPNQWLQRKDSMLSQKEKYLFLFDQDLSGNGGEQDGGIRIIATLLGNKDNEGIICGLLTHTVTPDNQIERWIELSDEHGIPRDRFLVLPKQFLSKAPGLFAQNLKLVALSADFTTLKEKIAGIIQSAAQVAATEVDSMTVYELDHMIFKIANSEGLWEPDMLFRLHSLFHRMESRRLAHEGSDLEEVASRLRAVSGIPSNVASSPPPRAWEIQRKELYESADYLNSYHLPLELGDIFVKPGSTSKSYILLVQPCDLMLRSNGTRQPELEYLTLLEVAPASPSAKYLHEMEYYGLSGDENWFVRLKSSYQVPSFILDMCVYDNDGLARLVVNSDPKLTLRPSLRARHPFINEKLAAIAAQIEIMEPKAGDEQCILNLKAEVRAKMREGLLKRSLFTGKVDGKREQRRFSFNCQRVGRLSRDRAFGLLLAYTSFLSRPAYERDFR